MARAQIFRRRSCALNRSEPTVWEQVRALERNLGTSLLRRHGREWLLTEEGQVLLDLAAPIVTSINALEESFSQQCGALPRTLTLVGTYTVIVEDLAWPIVDFCQDHPDIRVKFLNYVNTPILDLLTSGEVDLAILPLDLVKFSHRQLTLEPLYLRTGSLVMPEGHPLTRKRKIGPADIAAYPMILPAEADSAWRSGVNEVFRRAGVLDRLRISLEISFVLASRRYVSRGLWIALMPLPLDALDYPGVVVRPMDDVFPSEEVALVWRRGVRPRPQARLFAEYIRNRLEIAAKTRAGTGRGREQPKTPPSRSEKNVLR